MLLTSLVCNYIVVLTKVKQNDKNKLNIFKLYKKSEIHYIFAIRLRQNGKRPVESFTLNSFRP